MGSVMLMLKTQIGLGVLGIPLVFVSRSNAWQPADVC